MILDARHPLTPFGSVDFFSELVDGTAAFSSSYGLLLLGIRAFDGGVGAAGAEFAGSAGQLRGGRRSAASRQLGDLMVDDEDGFLTAAAGFSGVGIPMVARGRGDHFV
jgi:hypothetical protein